MKTRILLFGLFIVAIFLNGCANSSAFLAPNVCTYDSQNNLVCGSAWTVVSEGKEYNLEANKPLQIGQNKLIGLVTPGSTSEKDAFLLYTQPGTYEINEETSRRAVGLQITQGGR